jgi:hypothetical protein
MHGMSRMLAPNGFTAMSVGNRMITADALGCVWARPEEVDILQSFGFDFPPATFDTKNIDLEEMGQGGLVEVALEIIKERLMLLDLDELRYIIRNPPEFKDDKPTVDPEEYAQAIGSITEDMIPEMNRKALFVFLAENDIKALPKDKTEELRDKAREVFAARKVAEAEKAALVKAIADAEPEFPFGTDNGN